MGTYYNLRTDLKGGDVCDETVKFVVTYGELKVYTGKPKGFLRRGLDYTESKTLVISKSTKVEDKPLILPTGSGMVNIKFSNGLFSFHIFGKAQDFIKEINLQIQSAPE